MILWFKKHFLACKFFHMCIFYTVKNYLLWSEMIADHDREWSWLIFLRASDHVIVSDRGSHSEKVIVSDCGSQKKWSSNALLFTYNCKFFYRRPDGLWYFLICLFRSPLWENVFLELKFINLFNIPRIFIFHWWHDICKNKMEK